MVALKHQFVYLLQFAWTNLFMLSEILLVDVEVRFFSKLC